MSASVTPSPSPTPAVPATAARTSATPQALWRQLLDAASAPYRAAGRFAWHFARGKLRFDPVFRHLLESGLIRPQARLVDIGCGQGLLASLLQACGASAQAGRWPGDWPAAPSLRAYTGIELMPRDVARARAALAPDLSAPSPLSFICADMCAATLPECDTVVILDVLHYVSLAEQDALLARVFAALVPGGVLLLRVGDAAQPRGFAVSQWVDRLVTRVRGHRVPPTCCRALDAWVASLRALGFEVQPRPMSQGTPFANVLLVARRPAAAGQDTPPHNPDRSPP
jgi:SAM-dependent methyltransferase